VISGTGAFNFNFTVPDDFKKLLAAYVLGYPSNTAAGVGRVVSTSTEYNNEYGESNAKYSASALNVTYDLTGFANKRFHLPCTNLLANIKAGAEGGIEVNHVSMAGNVDYTCVRIIYI
jgi:hypothetical protein